MCVRTIIKAHYKNNFKSKYENSKTLSHNTNAPDSVWGVPDFSFFYLFCHWGDTEYTAMAWRVKADIPNNTKRLKSL